MGTTLFEDLVKEVDSEDFQKEVRGRADGSGSEAINALPVVLFRAVAWLVVLGPRAFAWVSQAWLAKSEGAAS